LKRTTNLVGSIGCWLKGIVAEAESLAVMQLIVQQQAEGQQTADAEEARLQLAEIDWDNDDLES
jgi:hypothetical protein